MSHSNKIYALLISVVVLTLVGINVHSLISPKNTDRIESSATSSDEMAYATTTESASTTASSSDPIQVLSYTFTGYGKNDHGQIAGPISSETVRKPYTIKTPYEITKLFAGKGHTLALTKEGDVLSWGQNDTGQLGYKTGGKQSNIPKKIEELKEIVGLSSTGNHSLAVNKNGEVYAWGLNFTGQLGTGDRINSEVPKMVQGLPAISKVAAGHKFSLAATKNGEVYAWGASCDTSASKRAKVLLEKMGSNILGLQGGYYDNTSNSNTSYDLDQDCLNEETIKIKSMTPVKLPVSGITQMSVGYGHALMLTSSGKVIAFGCNLYGQVGNEPGQKKGQWMRTVDGLENVKAVAAGARHSLFLTKDGSVYAAGANFSGQLGDRTDINRGTVAKVAGLPAISEIYAGFDYSIAVANDGTVWAWGINNDNFLVDNLPARIDLPVQISDKKPRQVTAGGMYVLFKY